MAEVKEEPVVQKVAKKEVKEEAIKEEPPVKEKEAKSSKDEEAGVDGEPTEPAEAIETQYKKLSGPKITGDKIDLAKFEKPKKKKEEPKKTDAAADRKKRRKRIVSNNKGCLLYTSPSPRDRQKSRMPSSA